MGLTLFDLEKIKDAPSKLMNIEFQNYGINAQSIKYTYYQNISIES